MGVSIGQLPIWLRPPLYGERWIRTTTILLVYFSGRNRTCDTKIISLVLYQLSYSLNACYRHALATQQRCCLGLRLLAAPLIPSSYLKRCYALNVSITIGSTSRTVVQLACWIKASIKRSCLATKSYSAVTCDRVSLG